MKQPPGQGVQLIPENAPFDEEQRAWLNGFLAGVLGLAAKEVRGVPEAPDSRGATARAGQPVVEAAVRARGEESGPRTAPEGDERRFLSVLAQLDCGQCGYSCQGYARALATAAETDPALCIPGGAATRASLEQLLADGLRSPRLRALAEGGNGRSARRDASVPVLAPASGLRIPHGSGSPEWWRAERIRVKSQRRLTLADAGSEIREVVLDLSGSQLGYRAGDNLAVLPHNDPDLVRALLRALGARGQEIVPTPAGPCEAWRCLLENLDITHVREETLRLFESEASEAEAARVLRELRERGVPNGFDLLDLLGLAPGVKPGIEQVVATLGALEPRLYAIASSPSSHPGEVRLAVRVVRRERAGRERKGVASSFLTEGIFKGDDVAASVQSTERHLAFDAAGPWILVAAGTGVARHRAFLEDLEARGRKASTWLILASCHDGDETLYDADFKAWSRAGVLEHLDVIKLGQRGRRAGPHDVLRRRARRVLAWLERGAILYACGEAKAFSGSLTDTLVEILSRQGNMTPGEATDFLHGMRRIGRYLEEVY